MARKDCDKQRLGGGKIRQRLVSAAAGCLPLLCCAALGEDQSVRVLPAALIDREQIRLADVALVQGFPDEQLEVLQTLVIGPAPDFGQDRSVTMQEVRERISATGANLAVIQIKGASNCMVRRPMALPADQQPVLAATEPSASASDQTLRAQLVSFLENKLKQYGGRVDVDLTRTPKELLDLSGPSQSFQIELVDGRLLGAVELRVTIRQRDGQLQTEKVAVSTSLQKDVVVAVSAIGRGQTITPTDLTMEERSFNKLEDIGLTDRSAAIGQEARRAVRVGEIIDAGDIKSRILVKRNDLVRIRCMTGGIELAATATALQPGSMGDLIEVLNNASGKTFWAKVTGLRQALVVDEPFEPLSMIRTSGELR